MDDEGASWMDDISSETPAAGEGESAGGEPGAPPAEEAPKEEPIIWARPPPAQVREIRKPDKPFTHWARPTFLQYEILYRYQHNYYDDLIDYLDRRQRGYNVEPPKAQTWAERALRGYVRDFYPTSPRFPRYAPSSIPSQKVALLNTPHWANTWHSDHSKDFYNRKYRSILF